jgi:hypothetical protein
MRALPQEQLLANPGLPGFARFGGQGFTQFGLLAGTAPGRVLGDPHPENFPVGKFATSGVYVWGGLLVGARRLNLEIYKTFLQESSCISLAAANFESAKRTHTGGRVMPTTQ